MNAIEILKGLGAWGPVFFGVGFIAPLIAQTMDALSVPGPFGLGTLPFGLALGVGAGLVAKLRGGWIG